MSSAEPTAPSFVSALVTQRRQVAIGLAVAGAILAGLAIWWGIWGFARSADRAPPKADGKLIQEEPEKPADTAEEGKKKHSPDYQIASVWAGGLALLTLLSAAWVYTQPADPAAPEASSRTEVLAFGGTAGLLTALFGAVLGYRWHQSLVQWVGSNDPREAQWVLLAAAVFLGGLLIMFVSLQLARTEQRTNATLRRVLYGFNTVFVGLLLLLVLIAVNVVAFIKIPNTLVTNESAFTELSEESKRFLRSLDRPVNVYLILHEAQAVPLGRGLSYDTMFADVRGLLSQSEEESRYFHAHYLSPAFDKEKIAALMQRLQVKETDRDQLGLLLAVGENEEATSFIRAADLVDIDRRGALVFQGEAKLMTELMYLTDARGKEKIYITQGHGELEVDGSSGPDKSIANLVQYLRDRKLTVEPLTFDKPDAKVPDDAAVVVVPGPRRMIAADDPMIGALRNYLHRPDRPGRLFACLPAFRNPQTGTVSATGLEPLMAEFGVEVEGSKRLVSQSRFTGYPPEYVVLAPFARLDPDLARVVGELALVVRDTRPVRPGGAPPTGGLRAMPLMGTAVPTWQEPDYQRALDAHFADFRDNPQLQQQKNLTQRAIPAACAVVEPGGTPDKPANKPRIVVFGTDSFLPDQATVPAAPDEPRQLLFSDTIDWLRERNASIGIQPRKVGVFVLDKPIDWTSQAVLLAMVGVGITALGVGVWLSRRR
jgi:hypothetical protein